MARGNENGERPRRHSAGPWKTLTETNGGISAESLPGGLGIVFASPYEKNGRVVITVTHTLKNSEVRIVAVGKDGREHPPDDTAAGWAANMMQMTVEFAKLSLRDIASFRFQSRPYEWVEFRNVSLRAGEKTDVRVVVPAEKPETRAELATIPREGKSAPVTGAPPTYSTGAQVEEATKELAPPATEAERAIARLVLVYFEDRSRRAVPAVLMNAGSRTLVVTTGPAVVIPDGTEPAIDRAFLSFQGDQTSKQNLRRTAPRSYSFTA